MRRLLILTALGALVGCDAEPPTSLDAPEPSRPRSTDVAIDVTVLDSPDDDGVQEVELLPDPPFEVIGVGTSHARDRALIEVRFDDGSRYELQAYAADDSTWMWVRNVHEPDSNWYMKGRWVDEETTQAVFGPSSDMVNVLWSNEQLGTAELRTFDGVVVSDPAPEFIVEHTARNDAADVLSIMLGATETDDGLLYGNLDLAMADYFGTAPQPVGHAKKNLKALICSAGAILRGLGYFGGPAGMAGAGAISLITCGAMQLIEELGEVSWDFDCPGDWDCDGIPDDEEGDSDPGGTGGGSSGGCIECIP